MLNLYLIERTDEIGYDEYDSVIVASTGSELAMQKAPFSLDHVTCKLIGTAAQDIPPGVVHSSFNAG